MDNEQKKRLLALRDNMKSYGYTDGVEELESIFPEIVENKDEMIRKIITLALIASEEQLSAFYSVHNITRKECTDWLEKQKAVTPCNVDEFTLTLRNCLFVDSELTKEQADIFATAYGEELLNVAIGKIESGLIEEDITDFNIERQKRAKAR